MNTPVSEVFDGDDKTRRRAAGVDVDAERTLCGRVRVLHGPHQATCRRVAAVVVDCRLKSVHRQTQGPAKQIEQDKQNDTTHDLPYHHQDGSEPLPTLENGYGSYTGDGFTPTCHD